jgi:P-type Mg2+ transporter
VTEQALTVPRVAAAPLDEVMGWLHSSVAGLSSAEASARLVRYGPNSVRTHGVSAITVLGRQLRNAVLALLAATAALSFFLGERTQAIIIGVILVASIGLGFVNEYRAERASAALHSLVRHTAVVRREGRFVRVDVTDLVPGDVIRLALGEAVPADVRLIDGNSLECNESILSGESTASQKSVRPVNGDAALSDSTDLAFMGTIVSAGDGIGVVYATGVATQFGRIAAGLGGRAPETEFQAGLRRFSYLLLCVAMTLTVLIIITNLLLHRAVIDSVLFALAIAVGITPQLLPAVVSTSLATGSRRLANALDAALWGASRHLTRYSPRAGGWWRWPASRRRACPPSLPTMSPGLRWRASWCSPTSRRPQRGIPWGSWRLWESRSRWPPETIRESPKRCVPI